MQCEAARPMMRQFLDDLLDEKDYQEMHAHVTGCTRCHAYASSIGTLPYRLYELGQVSLPPDMISTILYEFRKEAPPVPVAPAPAAPETRETKRGPGTLALWALIVALFLASSSATLAVFALKKSKQQADAFALFSTASKTGETTVPALSILPERHYHLSESSREELETLADQMGLKAVKTADRSIAIDLPRSALQEFESRFHGLSGVVKEFGEPVDEDGWTADARISVYFE